MCEDEQRYLLEDNKLHSGNLANGHIGDSLLYPLSLSYLHSIVP